MFQLNQPDPVKIFVGALWSHKENWHTALGQLEEMYGTCDLRREPGAFTQTDYYLPEMGPELNREFVSFPKLQSPADLSSFKLTTNRIEKDFCNDGKRTVNIDIGYLDLHKVILASTKPAPQKIYLQDGIWADLTMMFHRGDFHGFTWTFPDFKAGQYNDFLNDLRELYKKDLRRLQDS